MPHAAPGSPREHQRETDSPAPETTRHEFLDPPEQPGTVGKLGRFHVVEMIGRGGMGLVFRRRSTSACSGKSR